MCTHIVNYSKHVYWKIGFNVKFCTDHLCQECRKQCRPKLNIYFKVIETSSKTLKSTWSGIERFINILDFLFLLMVMLSRRQSFFLHLTTHSFVFSQTFPSNKRQNNTYLFAELRAVNNLEATFHVKSWNTVYTDRQCNIAGNLNHRGKLWHVTFDCNY